MLSAMHRIYFDTNEASYDEDGGCRYDLSLPSSMRDLASIEEPRDGMRVVIYMTRELEMEATLEFDVKLGHWMARPIEGTTRYPEAL